MSARQSPAKRYTGSLTKLKCDIAKVSDENSTAAATPTLSYSAIIIPRNRNSSHNAGRIANATIAYTPPSTLPEDADIYNCADDVYESGKSESMR